MDPIDTEQLRLIEREKGIPFDSLLAGLEEALAAAYRKSLPEEEGSRSTVDPVTGQVRMFVYSLDEEGSPVRDADGNYVGEREVPIEGFGRIGAQTAKQVILQKIREAEREMTFGEYAGRTGDIVTGIVQQSDSRYTLLDLGKVEALLPPAEQVPSERYEHGARLKAYIVDVRKTAKGPSIVVSRSHPGLVKALFALEVPEIAEGIVEIKAIAREAGHRTKLAVSSNEPGVDPVGACVGAKGSRVRMVVNELRGEKIDIIPWSDEAGTFVANALSPAKVKEVRINETEKTALVIVPDYQLSLAIGKEGQNARLAARLTGWRVDIKSETQVAEEKARAQAAPAPAAPPAPVAPVAPAAPAATEVTPAPVAEHSAVADQGGS
jgi:transcription termination/antitermination protein NusA